MSILQRNTKLIKAYTVILVVSLTYATAKVIAAYACPDSMLNITGCADVTRNDS